MQKLTSSLFRSVSGFSYLSFKKTRVFLYTRARVISIVGVTLLLSVALSSVYSLKNTIQTNAASSDTINFQSRLESSNGAIVPDGNYNVEFKLYVDTNTPPAACSSGGSALWTEDYLNSSSQGVRVSNGYLTANLGSITAFPSNIPWNDQLCLSLNIGGTTSGVPSWDGEMNPRLLLTAVPYAFQAQYATSLQVTSGSNTANLSFTTPTSNDNITLPDASGTVCLDNAVACGFASSTGSGSYIQNGVSLQSNANFDIQSNSTSNITGTIQALTSQTADLLRFENSAGSAALSGINSSGQLYYQSGSYTGTLAQTTLTSGSSTYYLPNTTGTQTICTIESGNCAGSGSGITGSGSADYVATFNTTSSIAASTLLYDNGSFVGLNTTTNSGLLSIAGNSTSQPSLFLQALGSATAPSEVIKDSASQTGDLLDLDNSSGSPVASIDSSGDLTAVNSVFSGTLGVASSNFSVNSSGNVSYVSGSASNNTLVCKNGSGQLAACSSAALSGNAFVQGGNAFGATGTLGTTDSNPLELEGDSNVGLTVTTTGDVGINTTSSLDSGTLSVLGQSSQVAEVVQGASSQDIADFYTSTPTKVFSIDSNGQLNSTLSSSSSNLNNLNLNTTNGNTGSSAETSNAIQINLTGTNNTHAAQNTLNGINFPNISSPATNNTYNGLNFGTGYSNLLEYNSASLVNGSGILQNAAIGSSTNYSNLNEVGALVSGSIASGFGTINTASNITTSVTIQGGTFTNGLGGAANFNVSGATLSLGNSTSNADLQLYNSTSTTFLTLQAASTASSAIVSIPDATGTVCISTNNCGYALSSGSTSAFMQGGNNFGSSTVGTLGTTSSDNGALQLEADGNVGLTVTTAGYVAVDTGSAINSGTFSVQALPSKVAEVDEGSGSDIADYLNSSSSKVAYIDSSGDVISTQSILAPTFDTPAGTTTLNIGPTNATSTINIGNSSAAINIQGSSSSSIAFGSGTSTSFSVAATSGITTLQGGNAIDLTTPTISASQTTPNSLSVEPGINNDCTASCSTSTIGANLNLFSGDATGAHLAHAGAAYVLGTPGNVYIDTGTSASGTASAHISGGTTYGGPASGGNIYLGQNYASIIDLGYQSALDTTININGGVLGIQGTTTNINTAAGAGATTIGISGTTGYLSLASAGNVTLSAPGTNSLLLDSTGAGTVDIANNNATTLQLGRSSGPAITIQGTASSSIAFGSVFAVAATTGIITAPQLTSGGATLTITNTGGHSIFINPGGSGPLQLAAGATQTGAVEIGNTTGNVTLTGPNYTTSSGGICINTTTGSCGTLNASIILLDLNQSSLTGSETAGNCSSTVNAGGLYYSAATVTTSTTTQELRGCINGAWTDVVTADQLGLIMLGVVPNSGSSNVGDLSGITGIVDGPCKVSWVSPASSDNVLVNPCTAYSKGRKVVINSAVTVNIPTTVSTAEYSHICLSGTNGAPTATTDNISETAGLPAFSATAPVLCIATILTTNAALPTIANIWDTRVFVGDTFSYTSTNVAMAPGWIAVQYVTSANQVTTTTSANSATVTGVIAVGSTSGSGGNTINGIMVTHGPAYVEGLSAGAFSFTAGDTAQTSTMAGYATQAAAAGGYKDLGLVINTQADSACSATTNCQYSLFVNVEPH